MVVATEIGLASGLCLEGKFERAVSLRPLIGDDEAVLTDTRGKLSPAEQVTLLLSRGIESLGSLATVSEAQVRQMTVGDRERLLLALCADALGDELDLVGRCPNEDCEEFTEISVSLSEFIDRGVRDVPALAFEKEFDCQGQRVHVRFRLPTGNDQEILAREILRGDATAGERLFSDCLVEVQDDAGQVLDKSQWLAKLLPLLEQAFSEIDPATDNYASLECVACGFEYTAVLDGFRILTAGLEGQYDIYTQVHRLSQAYHWSESDVLSLTWARRQRYLALVDSKEEGP